MSDVDQAMSAAPETYCWTCKRYVREEEEGTHAELGHDVEEQKSDG